MPAPARAFPMEATIEHYRSDPADPEGRRERVGETRTRCNLQPQWSREETANTDQSSRRWNLYLPPGTTLGHQDRVVFADVGTLEAIGEGRVFADFAGRPHHVEAILARVE
jgi:hypothetical protein